MLASIETARPAMNSAGGLEKKILQATRSASTAAEREWQRPPRSRAQRAGRRPKPVTRSVAAADSLEASGVSGFRGATTRAERGARDGSLPAPTSYAKVTAS